MISSLSSSLIKKLIQIDLFVTAVPKFDSSSRIILSKNKGFKFLKELLNKFTPYLQDAEEKQLVDDDLSDFLELLKHVAYDACDLLDDFILDSHLRRQLDNQSGINTYGNDSKAKVVHRFSNFFTKDLKYFRRGEKLKSIIRKLENFEKKISIFELNKTANLKGASNSYNCAIIRDYGFGKVSFHEENDCIGRELDKNVIFKKLFEENCDYSSGVSAPKVISIFGKGGIGKTTLAQSVYKDAKVQSHFGTKIWVSVPNTPAYLKITVVKLLEALSISVSAHHDDYYSDAFGFGHAEVVQLLGVLSKCVKQKKFLIVLDDVWDENFEKWDSLKQSLSTGAPGSSILMVTRNKACAYLMSTETLHELKPLTKDYAWELFGRSAFVELDDVAALKPFEDIGREMSLYYCRGIPLALKCLGGMMRTKTTRQEWEDVLESDTWELLEMQPFLPALCFSYYSLAPDLKLCLAYTAIFPKAHVIDKEMLIRMWMAEGFLGSFLTEDWEPELMGEQFVDELMMRSFFTAYKKDKKGFITHLQMNGLLHDLLIAMCGDSVAQVNYCSSLKRIQARHVSVVYSDMDSIGGSISKAKHVSTMAFVECTVASRIVSPNMFRQMKHLRVLDLSYLGVEEIPSQVGELKHLRYLSLSRAKVRWLPEKLCDLCELQTLVLSDCEELVELPNRLGDLCSLRHLNIDNTPKLMYPPHGIERLTSLRMLSKFPEKSRTEMMKYCKAAHELQGNKKTSFQSLKMS